MVEDLTAIYAIITVLLGVLAAVIIGNHFRRKNTEDLVDGLNASDRVRQKGGKVVNRNDGKIVSRHTVSFTTDVHLVDNRKKTQDESK